MLKQPTTTADAKHNNRCVPVKQGSPVSDQTPLQLNSRTTVDTKGMYRIVVDSFAVARSTDIGHRYLKFSLAKDRPTHTAHARRPIIHAKAVHSASSFRAGVRSRNLVLQRLWEAGGVESRGKNGAISSVGKRLNVANCSWWSG
jgi:hypothetical protein